MFDHTYRIMLAGRSLLYAPVYLAKIEQLSYAFRWVNFDYPTDADTEREEELGRDPVFFRLLNPEDDHNIVLAVADPLRLRYKTSTGFGAENAVILGGLIRAVCLWLVGDGSDYDYAKTEHKLSEKFNQIIAHRPEMTSFAVLAYTLRDELASKQQDGIRDKLTEGQRRQIMATLFRGARIGEEHVWASPRMRWRTRASKGTAPDKHSTLRPNAYITTDRSRAFLASEHRLKRMFLTESDYQDGLFSALVTSSQVYATKQALVEELKAGIERAVSIIYDDQRWAATCLLKDERLRRLLPPYRQAEFVQEYLEALVNNRAYNDQPGFRATTGDLRSSLKFHQAADEVLERAEEVSEDVLRKLFHPSLAQPEQMPPQPLKPVNAGMPSKSTTASLAAPVDVHAGAPISSPPIRRRLPIIANYRAPRPSPSWSHTWLRYVIGCSLGLLVIILLQQYAMSSQGLGVWPPLQSVFQDPNSNWCLTVVGVPIHRYVLFILSALAMWALIPFVASIIEGDSSGGVTRTILIWLLTTGSIVGLVWAIADWSAAVGALCNWAAATFIFIRYLRLQLATRMTFGERRRLIMRFLRTRFRFTWNLLIEVAQIRSSGPPRDLEFPRPLPRFAIATWILRTIHKFRRSA